MRKKIFISITIVVILIAVLLNAQIFKSLNELSTLSAKYQVTNNIEDLEHYVLISPNEFSLEWKNIIEGAMASAVEHNIVLEVIEIDNYSIELQLDYMETAIASKVDGIIIECKSVDAFDGIIDQAVGQGIKIAIINEDRPGTLRTLNVANNNYNEGQRAGEILKSNLQEGLVLIIQESGNNGFFNKKRTSGIKAYNETFDIKDEVMEVNMKAIEDGKTQLRDYINNHNIEGIFATTSDVTLMTAETLERLGLDIPLVGVGDYFDTKNHIRDNRIDYSFIDNYFLIGEKSVEHLMDNSEGQILIDSLLISKSNLD